MLIFATCKDLEANLEARQAGSSVHSNTAAPEPFMTQSSSIEDISIACGAERALEAEGGQHNTYKVLIPEDTVGVFLDLAKQNTNQNIETVGILAGNVTSPNIRVTHLVVPRQKGDSTTCECLEEELVVATLQENDVVQVGWIHTHPSHSTFLSSIDVHTQYRLQRDIPEAVAIVHSHRDGQTGYFRLTERGMRDIANCQEDGFHEGCARAENWGTVQTLSATDLVNIKAIDLRKVQNKKGQTEKMEESKQKQDNSQNDCGRAWKATEEMTQKGNSCLAENEQQEGPPQEMGDSSTTEQTSKEDSCLPAQVPQQEVCSVTAKSRQTEENTDDMNKKEQSGNNTGKDQKLKRQRKARADVQMADILAENQALKVEIQQLRTQLGDVDQQVDDTAKIPQQISGQPLCAACCGYLIWLHKQYQAESKTVAQDEHMQHTQEDPGQTNRWTAGQVRQGAELMHQGTAKTSQKQKTSQEPEPHQNNPQGTNATWKESDKSQQENMAAEGAWLSRNGRAADLLECVAPRAKEIGTDQAGVQEISIVREQRTIGTQTHNSGDMQRQEVNQGGMDQHEFVRSSKRPDQWRTGELMWQEQPGPTNHMSPGPTNHMSQHRYTGGQHLPR